MPAVSSARLLYEKILSGGSAFLESLVTTQTFETESLDFKSGEYLDDDKETWSEAICGFANNQGGVLIWGIDARKDKATNIDAACDIRPVMNPAALRSRLVELLRGAVEPGLTGVEVQDFYRCGTSGEGFVACYVPESDLKPHRAEMLKNKPYKIRIADSFVIPSPSVLRNLFFPRSNAQFEIEVTSKWEPWRYDENAPNRRIPPEREISHRVTLHNSGHASAKDIFVILLIDTNKMSYESFNSKRNTESGIGLELIRPIHPSSSEQVCVFKYMAKVVTRSTQGKTDYVLSFSPIEFRVLIAATDTSIKTINVTISEGDIESRRSVRFSPTD